MARPAHTLKVGTRVQYIDNGTLTMQNAKITSIVWALGAPTMMVSLSTLEDPIEIAPYQELVFPRRYRGMKIVHQNHEDLSIYNLMVGDIIPPENGWVCEVEDGIALVDLSTGYEILQAHPFNDPRTKVTAGWRVVYRRGDEPSQQRYLAMDRIHFWNPANKTFPINIDAQTGKPPVPKHAKNTSGVYRNKETDELATFKIHGAMGRPPIGSRPAFPLGSFLWKEWEFLGPGQRHPFDVQLEATVDKQ